MIINDTEVHIPFDYVREIALHGGGTANNKDRIFEFFSQNASLKDRTYKVKDEYCNYGFGLAFCDRKVPFLLQSVSCFGNKIDCEYTDGLGVLHEAKVSYSDLAKKIGELIDEGKYFNSAHRPPKRYGR